MHDGLILDLAVVTVVAAVTAMLSRRLGQPSILGYLFAGLIVGPYLPVPLFADPHRMEELAEVGVVLVLFAVGLEFRIRRLLDILPISGITAAVQILALSISGFLVGSALGWSAVASVCLGASISISSTMVVSAVLRTHPVERDVRSHVLGILVVQDVVAIVLMAIVTALAAGESLGWQGLGMLFGELAAAIVAMLVGGLLVLPRLVRYALSQADDELLVVLVVGAAFGLALAASLFGYSIALGAFLSGMVVAESGRGHDVERAIEPLRGLFAAIFFVSIGMSIDPVVAWRNLPFALLLSLIVIGAQFVSVLAGSLLTGMSLRRGAFSGLLLGQVGELSFILATIAIAGGVMPRESLPALVTVATITTFTTPLLLGRAERIVTRMDHALPARAHQVLAAYQSFLRNATGRPDKPSPARAIAGVLLDLGALLVVFVLRHQLQEALPPDAALPLNIVTVALSAPFVLGLLRSALHLSLELNALLHVGQAGPTPRAHATELFSSMLVVLAIGTGTALFLHMAIPGPWAQAMLLTGLLLLLVLVGLHLGRHQHARPTSSVARMAQDLQTHLRSGEERAPSSHEPDPLATFDHHRVRIEDGSPAEGSSLATLDLRSRTGATVAAIVRGHQTTMFPTGQEILLRGDILAVSGSPEALARAERLLAPRGGPEVKDVPTT